LKKNTDALIKARLYSTEERPFKRIQKRCTNLLESDTITEVGDARDRLIEEIELDFASFEAAIMRVQLLTDANRKEVARYEEMREEIRAYRFLEYIRYRYNQGRKEELMMLLSLTLF